MPVAPKSLTLPAGDGPHALYAWTKDRAGNVSERATLTVTLDTAAPVAVITAPLKGPKLTVLAAIRGTATDATTGLASVWIALRWKVGTTCSWWDGAKFAERACNQRLFVRATGKATWRLALPRIAGAGSYTAYAYGVDRVGNRQIGFTAGKNLVSFTITNNGVTPDGR